jgi:hypothetical protein
MEAVEEGVLFGALYRIGVADRGGGDDKRRRPLVGFEGSSVRQLCEDEGEQQEGGGRGGAPVGCSPAKGDEEMNWRRRAMAMAREAAATLSGWRWKEVTARWAGGLRGRDGLSAGKKITTTNIETEMGCKGDRAKTILGC